MRQSKNITIPIIPRNELLKEFRPLGLCRAKDLQETLVYVTICNDSMIGSLGSQIVRMQQEEIINEIALRN